MNLIKIAAIIMVIGVFASCKKGGDLVYDLPNMKDPQIQPLPQDIWIRDSLTIPYNIAVKYKWDAMELDLYRTLVPPNENAIIPALRAVKKVWIDTYVAEAGEVFFKKLCPKQLVMVGSANYETDGTVILATAEGGRKIVLYDINHLDNKNSGSLAKLLHIIEHEFAHILHQNVRYPTAFSTLTPGYTSNWTNFRIDQANNLGFITPYAMASPDEDFAEMVATILTNTKAAFDDKLKGITSAEGREALKIKEGLIVNYFNNIYGIDIYSLQARTMGAINYVTTH